jgi:hypothetical protein
MGKNLKTIFLWLLIFSIPLQLAKHFWPDWSYVWGMRIDYLSPAFYLSDIFLLVCFFLNRRKIISQINFKKNWLKIFFILIFVFLNCFFANTPLVALLKWGRIVSLAGFYLLVRVQRSKVERILRTAIPVWIVGLFLISALQAFFQSSLGGVFWWLGERSFDVTTPGIAKTFLFGRFYLRSYAIFSHPNSLAGFLIVSMAIYFALEKTSPVVKKIVLVLGSLAVGLTLSRSAIIAGTILLAFHLIKKKNWIFIILVIFLLWFILTIGGIDLSFSRRISLALASLDIFVSSPIVGVGLNNFIISLPLFWRQDLWLQPVHNIFLLILSETGLVGFIIFLKFIFKTTFSGQYLPAFLLIMITGLFDHYWLTLIQNMLMFVLVIGLIKSEN